MAFAEGRNEAIYGANGTEVAQQSHGERRGIALAALFLSPHAWRYTAQTTLQN